MGVRLNINLGEISPEDASPDQEHSRFGFSFSSDDFLRVVKEVENCGYLVRGIHAHRTSKTRSLQVYERICHYIEHVIHNLNLHLSYIDIGGGFCGSVPGRPGYDDYFRVMQENLHLTAEQTLIVEPGSALIAEPVEFVTTVFDIKELNGIKICQCDGSRWDVDPLFQHDTHQYKVIHAKDQEITSDNSDGKKRQLLTGFTCLENDKIMYIEKEKVHVNDRIIFYRKGAYSLCMTPNFIRLLPRVYARKKDALILVRDAWSISEATQKCRLL